MYGIRTWRREALAKLCADPISICPISICDERKIVADALLQRMNEAVAPISVRRSFEEILVVNVNFVAVRHVRECHCTVAKHVRSDRAVGRGVWHTRPIVEASPHIRAGGRLRPTSRSATSMTS